MAASSNKAGTVVGRVAVRAIGSFHMKTARGPSRVSVTASVSSCSVAMDTVTSNKEREHSS